MEMNIITKEKPHLIMFRIILIFFSKSIDTKMLGKPRNKSISDRKLQRNVGKACFTMF